MYKTMDINKTIKENVGLIYKVINRHYYDKKYDFAKDDMVQVGMLALYKAIMNYDESKGLKFSTLAMTVIKNDLCTFMTRDYEKKYSGLLDDSVTSINETLENDDESYTRENFLSVEEDFSSLEGLELLNYIRERKSEKVVKMVELLAKGYTNEEVGKALGCSKQNVNATMKRLADELRRNSSSVLAYQIIKG